MAIQLVAPVRQPVAAATAAATASHEAAFTSTGARGSHGTTAASPPVGANNVAGSVANQAGRSLSTSSASRTNTTMRVMARSTGWARHNRNVRSTAAPGRRAAQRNPGRHGYSRPDSFGPFMMVGPFAPELAVRRQNAVS